MQMRFLSKQKLKMNFKKNISSKLDYYHPPGIKTCVFSPVSVSKISTTNPKLEG